MKRTDSLITTIRSISRNSADATGVVAISDVEIIQYLNDAQDRLQNMLCATKNIAKIFAKEIIIPSVSGQEPYSVADRVLLNKQIEQIEYSATGQTTDYVRLEKLNMFNRDTNIANYPWGYFKRENKIFLQPTPANANGTLRVTYEQELDDLQLRCGDVSTITETEIDLTNIVTAALPAASDFVCVTDTLGARILVNVPISTSAPILTGSSMSSYIFGNHVIADAVGGYVTAGRYTTSISQMPDNCERYLIHYAAMEIFQKDSSKDFDREAALVDEIEKDITKTLSSQTSEIQFIPQADRYEWF